MSPPDRTRYLAFIQSSARHVTLALNKDAFLVASARAWIRYAPTLLLRERLWRFVHWRLHHYTARTRLGFRMRGRSNDLVQGYAYFFGIWEPNLTTWLAGRLTELSDSIFLDIGANVGYYALLARSRLEPGSSVVAVEASPMIHRMLLDNIELNGFDRIRTVQCAAACERGTVTLHHGDDRNLGQSSTVVGVWDDRSVVVEAKPLGDILSASEVARVRLIKIDVEGAESAVVKGLQPLLVRLPQDVEIVVEISAGNANEIFDLFESEGFHAYGLPNLYSYKCYLSPAPIDMPTRLRTRPTVHGDVVFSRRDQHTL